MTEPTHNSTGTESFNSVAQFFAALHGHDLAGISTLLSDDVVEVVPFSPSGDPEPWVTYDGKESVIEYLSSIMENFSKNDLVDTRHTVSDDGTTVFVEARGDLVQAVTHTPYRNNYVFKFVLADGKITHLTEYANPVPIAKLMGVPLG